MTNLDTVPETDAEVDAILDAANEAPAEVPTPTPSPEVPATPVVTLTPPPPHTGNSAYADEETRGKIVQAMADLKTAGFKRPEISAVTGMTDSALYRAQNGRVHTVEVPTLLAFIELVVKGEVKPKEAARKPKVEDLEAKLLEVESAYQARIAAVIEALGSEAKTTAQYRKIIEAAQAALTELVPTPEAPAAEVAEVVGADA